MASNLGDQPRAATDHRGTVTRWRNDLSGADRTAAGEERQVRGTWKPMTGGVREIGVASTDGGKTWQPWFDLMFRTHMP